MATGYIPRYQRQVTPGGVGATARVDPRMASSVGASIAHMGINLSADLKEVQQRMERQDELNYLMESELAFRDGWREVLTSELTKTGKDTYGNVQRAEAWIAENSKTYLDRAPNPQVKQQLQMRLQAISHQSLDNLAFLQAKERKAVTVNNIEALVESNRRDAYLAPDQIFRLADSSSKAIDEAVASGVLEETAARELKSRQSALVHGSALEGIIDRDPYAARQALQDFAGHLTAQQLNTYHDRIESKIKGLQAEQERQLNKAEAEANRRASVLWRRSDDALASLAETGKEGIDIESGLRSIGTPEAVEKADDYAARKQIAIKTYGVMNKYQDLPFADQMQHIDQDFAITPGEQGAKEKIHAAQMAVRVVRDREARFLADPSSYAAGIMQKIQGETPEQYADRLLDTQRDLAKGMSRFEPRLFSKDEIKSMSERYNGMDASGKMEMIRGLQEFGKHSGKVLNDIGAGSAAQLALQVDSSSSQNSVHARTLIEAASLKESEIPGDPKTKAAAKKEVVELLQNHDVWRGMTERLKYQPQNTALLKHVNAMQQALENMAMIHGDAKKALEFFDSTYNSLADDDIGFLVYPKQSTITPKQFEVQLQKLRSAVPGFLEWQRKYLGDDLHNEKTRDAAEHGIWVNASDGNGYVLLNPNSGMPITAENGALYRVTLDDILRAHDSDVIKSKTMKDAPYDPSGMGGSDLQSKVLDSAKKYGVDQSLALALVKQESGWKPDATSPKGAMGLMQLMPGTAKDLGVSDPYDPDQNIDAGMRYLAKQIDTFGSPERALVAYNWGPENAKKWDGKRSSLPAETREYLKRILG